MVFALLSFIKHINQDWSKIFWLIETHNKTHPYLKDVLTYNMLVLIFELKIRNFESIYKQIKYLINLYL